MTDPKDTNAAQAQGTKLSEADIARVAQLCKLELSTAQASDQRDQLARIIGYVEQIRELDLNGVDPLTRVTEEVNRLAESDGTELAPGPHTGPLDQEAAAKAWPAAFETMASPDAPEAEPGDPETHRYIRVPKVIGDA